MRLIAMPMDNQHAILESPYGFGNGWDRSCFQYLVLFGRLGLCEVGENGSLTGRDSIGREEGVVRDG
jgi:hypothetical protein